MNKICTSLNQSKKLIKLRIDRKTSDMYYWCGEDLRIGGYKAQDDKYDIPAWSLSALLELIPSTVFLYTKLVKWDENYYIEHKEMLYDNPVDAVFEMVCWLKENEKI